MSDQRINGAFYMRVIVFLCVCELHRSLRVNAPQALAPSSCRGPS